MRLRAIAEQQKMGSTVLKSKESSSVKAFLNNKKDQSANRQDVEDLKKKYFNTDTKKSWFKSDTSSQFDGWRDVERYIDSQNRKKKFKETTTNFWSNLKATFRIDNGSKSIYVWHSRKFEEFMYMHIPRFLFLAGSCFVIYTITLENKRNQRWKQSVTSHRQEAVDAQI